MCRSAPAQTHREDETRDTVDNEVIPVIFVPGVMGSRIAMAGEEWNTNSASNMVGWSLTGRREVMRLLGVQTAGTIPNDIPRQYLSHGGLINPQNDLTGNRRTLEIAVLRVDRSLLQARGGRGGVRHNQRRREVVTNFWQNRGFGEVDWPSYFLILRDLVNGLNPGPGFFEPRPVYACGYDCHPERYTVFTTRTRLGMKRWGIRDNHMNLRLSRLCKSKLAVEEWRIRLATMEWRERNRETTET